MDTVRAVVRYWRETRKGSLRLCFTTDRIVTTICEGSISPARVQPTDTPLPHLGSRSASHMGTFL